MKKECFLIFMIFFCISCKGENRLIYGCDSIINLISANNVEIYDIVISKEKKAISCLIENMDMNKTKTFGFLNPRSSHIPEFFFKANPVGVKFAYLVEFVLSKDSIEVAPNWNSDKSNWEESVKPYRIYDYCVIVRKNKENKPIEDVLNHSDMKKIKKIYTDWWKKNKNKSIEQLRRERKEKGSILKGSDYMWI